MPRLPSISALARAAVCPASEALPRSESITPWSSRGTVIHKYLADVPRLGRDQALEAVPEDLRPACDAIDLNRLPSCEPESYAAEVALAYDVATGEARELGRNIERGYERFNLKPTEIPGTVDVIGLTDDAVLILDYKSGFQATPPAAKNWQLKGYAVAAARTYKRERAHVAIVRIFEDGGSWFDWYTFEAFELDCAAVEIAEVVERVQAARAEAAKGVLPVVVESEECGYCAAFNFCPAKTAMARAFTSAPERVESFFEALTASEQATAWKAVQRAKGVVERAEKKLRELAREHPIDLGDGVVLGALRVEKERLDAAKAQDVLEHLHGEAVAGDAIEIEVSKAGIKRALRKVVEANPKLKITHLEKAVLAEIEKRGGISIKVEYQVREHRPKPAPVAELPPASAEAVAG